LVSIDTTIISTLISAVVSLTIVLFNMYYFESKRKSREEKTHRVRLLGTWISDMNSNHEALNDRRRRLELLVIDNRALDCLALAYPELVRAMCDVHARIVNLNRDIEFYDMVIAQQMPLQVPEHLEGVETTAEEMLCCV